MSDNMNFKKWFIAQFGSRPKGKRNLLEIQRHQLNLKIAELNQTLNQLESWDKRYDAAFKAWEAKKSISRFIMPDFLFDFQKYLGRIIVFIEVANGKQ